MPVNGEGVERSGRPSILGRLLLAGKEARPCVSWGREYLWIEILASCLQGDTFVFCLAWQRVKQDGRFQGELGVTVLPRKALRVTCSSGPHCGTHYTPGILEHLSGNWVGGCPGGLRGDSDAEVALRALCLGHDSQTLAHQSPEGLNSCWSLPRVSDSLSFGRPENLHLKKKLLIFIYFVCTGS